MERTTENNQCIYINQYGNLLEKLYYKGLLTPTGAQLRSREYCVHHDLRVLNFSDKTIYSGILIPEVKDLSDYEVVMLMAREDVIAYQINRAESGWFTIVVFK